MDPITAIQLGILLANTGIKIWGDIKAVQLTTQADGTEDMILRITIRKDRLAEYMTQQQSDLAETLAEIARRHAIEEPTP